MTHPQDTTPANPAQVTNAMVEAASAKYREIGARCNWQHSWPSEEAFHEIISAAIGAGGQAVKAEPVAYQYRIRSRDWPTSPWTEWSEWREGRAPYLTRKPDDWGHYDAEERPLYTHPAPSGQARAALADGGRDGE